MRRFVPLALVSVLALLLAGCGTQLGASGTGSARVLLTDAPTDDADALQVAFGSVQLIPADGSAPVTVADSAGSYDILQLSGGVTTELGATGLPAGTYDQIRFIVDSATLVKGTDEFPVKVPSGAQTGLKVNVQPPLVVTADHTSTVTIDFDAARAVIATPPGSTNFLLKPTAIRAVTTSGILTGAVTDGTNALSGATVTVSQDGSAVTGATTADDGSFTIITLPEGTYDVTLDLTGYVSVTQSVTITAGQTTDLGTLVLAPVAP